MTETTELAAAYTVIDGLRAEIKVLKRENAQLRAQVELKRDLQSDGLHDQVVKHHRE